jgi:predicted PhzF superfamily epimerase YddE/YHI9
MHIDKQDVIKLLREQGQNDKAEQAQQQLPDKVDHEQHAGLLQQLGINPRELLSKL